MPVIPTIAQNIWTLPHTFPFKRKQIFLFSSLKEKAFSEILSGYAPTQVTFFLSKVPKSQRVIRTGHSLLYFCLLRLLLTILNHLLTQHIPLLKYLHCIPPHGHQGTQHLDYRFQFATRCSKVTILSSIADVCYVLHPPENKTNIDIFSSQGLEASFPQGLYLVSFFFCLLFPTVSFLFQSVLPVFYQMGKQQLLIIVAVLWARIS